MAGQDSRNYRDDNGHGTHMAGIIAARMNRLGVVGVAYQAQIVAVKVLDQYGNGRLSDLINGLGWISTNKIRIVNMSLGFWRRVLSSNRRSNASMRRAYHGRLRWKRRHYLCPGRWRG